jgi:hypothetical protein
MSSVFAKALANRGRRRSITARLHLVDRSECPAFLNLTALTDDPDLQRYIQAQVSRVKSDFQDDSVFPGSWANHDCSCSPAGTSHQRLAVKIKANGDGWQDELAQKLLNYVISHLSANIVSNVHEALAVDQPLNWRGFAPCDARQNSNNPSSVLQAAGNAIQSRLLLKSAALKRCTITGALLNVIKAHWLACEWFRREHNGSFPEHDYLRHELLQEALDTYLEHPTQETFDLCRDSLRCSLAALPCPLVNQHPHVHRIQQGPAAEDVETNKTLQISSHL